MRKLETELVGILGEARATIIFSNLKNSTFAGGGSARLTLTPNWQRTPADDPFAPNPPVGEESMHVEITLTDGETGQEIDRSQIWLNDENTPVFFERFGAVLGVETSEELHGLLDATVEQ
jgi:hypothetical protein